MKVFRILTLAFLALYSHQATAQERQTGPQELEVGLGVDLLGVLSALNFTSTTTGLSLTTPATVYFPVAYGNLRIEPGIAYLNRTFTSTSTGIVFEPNAGDQSSRTTKLKTFHVDLGVMYQRMIDSGFSVYAGPRVGYSSGSEIITNPQSDGTTTTSTFEQTATNVGLAIGGEYYLSKHFTLGAELLPNYVVFSNPTIEPSSSFKDTETTQKDIKTTAGVFIRWYF